MSFDLEGVRFESGIGRSVLEYFHIFCSVCCAYLSKETQNQSPESCPYILFIVFIFLLKRFYWIDSLVYLKPINRKGNKLLESIILTSVYHYVRISEPFQRIICESLCKDLRDYWMDKWDHWDPNPLSHLRHEWVYWKGGYKDM